MYLFLIVLYGLLLIFGLYRIISDLKSLKRRVVENSVIIIISGIVAFVAGLFSDVAKYLIAVNGLILFFLFY